MTGYRLSRLAEHDLNDIVDYTTDTWGAIQANAYLSELVECFIRVAQMPSLGRTADSVHPGFRRIQQGKHVIFYKPGVNGIFISRILHQTMLPSRRELIENEG